MSSQYPPKKNAAFTLFFTLRKTDNTVITNPGNFTKKVSIDGAAVASIAASVTKEDTTYGQCSVVLSAAEMNGDAIWISIVDDTPGAVPFITVLYTTANTLDERAAQLGIVTAGTMQTGSDTTHAVLAVTSLGDDIVNGSVLVVLGGTGAGQTRLITDWDNATDTVTVDPPFVVTPDGTSTYVVLAAPPSSTTAMPTVTLGVGGITASTFAAGALDAAALSDDAVDAILDEVVEGTTTLRQMLRGFASVLLSKVSGAGSTTITFRDIGDTKNRIVATVDEDSNRTAITLTLT